MNAHDIEKQKLKSAAILMLVEGAAVVEVARKIGVSRRTIYNWLQEKRFQKELLQTHEITRRLALMVWTVAQEEACNSLRDGLKSDNLQEKMHAQDTILKHSLELEKLEMLGSVERALEAARKM